MGELSGDINSIAETGIPVNIQNRILKKVSDKLEHVDTSLNTLKSNLRKAIQETDINIKADLFENEVLSEMNNLRTEIDSLESLLPAAYWPVPTYTDLLFKL